MRASSRQLRMLGCTAVVATTGLVAITSGGGVSAQKAETAAGGGGGDRAAKAKAATRPARSKPVALGDAKAAELVDRSGWEPRPRNRAENGRRPSRDMLRKFRRVSALPRAYKRRVSGNFRGTTDEIIQWAAHKWGFAPDLLRAVGAIESWWKMQAVGDEGRSFGIMQVKRGPHCCFPATRRSTAFNADYYGAWLRSIYDGRARWLNHERRGKRYRRGDLWGSVGVWYSGRWHHNSAHYVGRVKNILRKGVWKRSGFRAGG